MSYNHTAVIIVPLSIVDSANQIARAFDPDSGGDNTFGTVLLSPTGALPATHTGCNTAVKQSFVDFMDGIGAGLFTLHDLVASDYAARWVDLPVPAAEECAEFWAQAIIRLDEIFQDVINELGLTLTQENING